MKRTSLFLCAAMATIPIYAQAPAAPPAAPQPAAPAAETPAPQPEVNPEPIERRAPQFTSFAPIVERVAPSVVTISSTRKAGAAMHPFMQDPFFRRYFGLPDGAQPEEMPAQQGLGSGVVVTKEGHVLTNNHVIQDADEVRVMMPGSTREYPAKVIGTDAATDLAVLQIEAENLSPITFGDDTQLRVGDLVLAVGNPFGIGQSVTQGIVSALGRSVGAASYENFIQTDAPINRGNSGGALIDMEGRLVGINTAILSQSGGSVGIGLAIPASLAQSVMKSIIETGKVVRGYIGTMIQPLDQELAEAFNITQTEGALIAQVEPGSPAEKAGIRKGDVVVSLNGRKIPSPQELRLSVSQLAPGSQAQLGIVRDGKEQKIEVTIGELPGTALAGGPGRGMPSAPQQVLKGVAISDIDPQTRQQLNIPEDVIGALVTRVEPGSAAARAMLARGDVIQEVNRQPVENAQQAREQISKAPKGGRALLLVWSRGGSRYVALETGS